MVWFWLRKGGGYGRFGWRRVFKGNYEVRVTGIFLDFFFLKKKKEEARFLLWLLGGGGISSTVYVCMFVCMEGEVGRWMGE